MDMVMLFLAILLGRLIEAISTAIKENFFLAVRKYNDSFFQFIKQDMLLLDII
jgi:hypothetical protein